MVSLHSYFEKVFVIHMEKDKEREQHIQQQFQQITTNYEFRKGILPTQEEREKYCSPMSKYTCSRSMLGIYLAHRYIWEEMVQKNISRAVIFEDDVTFTDQIASVFPKAMQELPSDWDMVYLGCITCSDCVSPWIQGIMKFQNIHTCDLQPYSNHLRIPSIALGTEAYALTLEGAKKLLHYLPYAVDHVDMMITKQLKNLHVYSIYPLVAYQHPSGFQFSNNNTKTPVLLNQIASSIQIISLPYTHISLAYALSIPLAQFHDELIWNGWCIVFLCLGFLPIPTSVSLALLGYLLLEWIYRSWMMSSQDKHTLQYLFYALCVLLGRLIVIVLFRLF